MSGSGAELTLIAKYESFVYQPEHSIASNILKASQDGSWAPGTAEWIDTARQGGARAANIIRVGDVKNFVDVLQFRQSGNLAGKPNRARFLKRVNLFAHASKTDISFNGTISQPKAAQQKPQSQSEERRFIADVSIASGNGSLNTFTLDNLRERKEEVAKVFVQDASMYVYACHSGINAEVLQAVADFFRITVYGFRDLIEFCPRTNVDKGTKRVARGETKLFYKMGESNCAAGSFDFYDLKPSATFTPGAP